jgi:two-component system, NtrC family, sensor kinase
MEENSKDLILVVEENPAIAELIANQALQAAGYRTAVVNDSSAAEAKFRELKPDLIIINHDMQGLSAKDFLVILNSSGIDIPVILLAKKGKEAEIIQSFRLGAADYLLLPVRETEVLAAVERVLAQLHNRRERAQLEQQINQANAELQQRLNELTRFYSIGKTFTSTTDQAVLYEKVIDSAIEMTTADLGWFLLRDEGTRNFILVAHRNLPAQMCNKLHEKWDDGISLLVAKTGKMLNMHGDVLQRFPISKLGKSILIVPIMAQSKVIGLLVMMRKRAEAFTGGHQSLLEAIADYASVALDNARLFLAVEERMRALEVQAEDAPAVEQLDAVAFGRIKREQSASIESIVDTLERLTNSPVTQWATRNRRDLTTLQDQVQKLIHLAEKSANGR